MKKHSKRYTHVAEKVDKEKVYKLSDAIDILKEVDQKPKFDEAVDISFSLGVDTRHSDQMVRGTVTLPHGTGKLVRVAVFTKEPSNVEAAKSEGAEHVGDDDLIEKVKGGWTDFDVAIATPDLMKDLSKLGKILGPKGLMPSPKAGTVTQEIGKAVKEVKKGKIEYKIDKTSNLHVSIGKLSFEKDKLAENGLTVIEAIYKAKPSGAKGVYMKRCVISSTMSPGLGIDLKEINIKGI
ncbi:MAG: 50S ribosomal protein L1 [Candidatus Ancaeobacter aquaticus]|nr:50S ribosomal protein L1 [Candidatus Ancaeobacter aquaticus]